MSFDCPITILFHTLYYTNLKPTASSFVDYVAVRSVIPHTRTHAQLYVLRTLISRVTILVCTGRLLAAAFNTRRTLTHTDPLFQLPLLSQLCLCLLKPQFTDDKLSRPRGCGLERGVHHNYIHQLKNKFIFNKMINCICH